MCVQNAAAFDQILGWDSRVSNSSDFREITEPLNKACVLFPPGLVIGSPVCTAAPTSTAPSVSFTANPTRVGFSDYCASRFMLTFNETLTAPQEALLLARVRDALRAHALKAFSDNVEFDVQFNVDPDL